MRLYIKFVFAFLVALHSNFLLAQSENQETLTYDESDSLSSEQLNASASDQAAITWPVLPGESVEDLAALFYPKNKKMQHRFIVKTMQLSQEIRPSLDPAVVSKQANLIIIPNIKYLAKHNGYIKSAYLKKKVSAYNSEPRLQKIYGDKDDAKFGISSKIQAIFDNLLVRNAIFKQYLDNLNIKLANLKPKLESLKTGLVHFFDLAFSIAESNNKLAKQKQEAQVQNNLPIEALVKNQAAITAQTTAPISSPVEVTPTRLGQSSSSSWELWIPILSVILVMSLLSGLYVRRKLKDYHPISTLGSSAVEKKPVVEPEVLPTQRAVIDQVADVSVVEAEFSGSIPDAEPEVGIDLVKKEEVEQALEQAKIYINLNRLKEAIMLLKTQIQETPKAALHHWFCLLDLYRKSNQKEDFLDNAKQLHENFNVMMPQWEKTTYPSLAALSLEELPHIIEKLTEIWTAESKVTENMVKTRAYLDELLMDNRSTERIGFGIEVFQEIMLLRDMLDTRFKLSLDD